jgi:hypothetical protein
VITHLKQRKKSKFHIFLLTSFFLCFLFLIIDASSSNEAVHLQQRLKSLSTELVTLRNRLHVGQTAGGGVTNSNTNSNNNKNNNSHNNVVSSNNGTVCNNNINGTIGNSHISPLNGNANHHTNKVIGNFFLFFLCTFDTDLAS